MPEQHSIEWICNHSRNTQLALLNGYIDIALTYERDQEHLAASEGWSRTAGCVMHDHFCFAGPADDPAGVRGTKSLSDALTRIEQAEALFHSRADASATMFKERGLWQGIGRQPWEHLDDASVSSWYKTSVLTPADALKKADHEGAYLLTVNTLLPWHPRADSGLSNTRTGFPGAGCVVDSEDPMLTSSQDRSTLLRQVALGKIAKTTVFLEPDTEDHVLMNSCYALCSPTATPDAIAFVKYLLEERAQGLIEAYGKEEAGLPFFAKAAHGFARTRLADGRPVDGKWIVQSSV